jgi:phage host-nuclease inhibitor protein Gam
MGKRKKNNALKNASNVFVRNLKAKDNRMLDQLREITGYKSNARNVMIVSHKFLEQRKQIEALTNEVASLKEKAATAENDHRNKLAALANDHSEKIEVVKSELRQYQESVQNFIEGTVLTITDDLKSLGDDLKQGKKLIRKSK